jgi:hypothetical protein
LVIHAAAVLKSGQMYIISFSRVNSLAMGLKISIVKLVPIGYLSNDQILKKYDSINQTATAEGFTLLPKQVSDLFQIETSYLRQNNDIVIIQQVPSVNVQALPQLRDIIYSLLQ